MDVSARPIVRPVQIDMFETLGASPHVRPGPAWHERPELGSAITRHGRIVSEVLFARWVGDPVTPEQRAEVHASRAALDAINPRGSYDLEAAFAADRSLIGETQGGRTQRAIRAMRLEAEMRVDPKLRADMFVRRWQALEHQRRLLLRDREDNRAGKVAESMTDMAKALHRDPQLESLLRNRKHELGIAAIPREGIARGLMDMVERGRSRGLGIGM